MEGHPHAWGGEGQRGGGEGRPRHTQGPGSGPPCQLLKLWVLVPGTRDPGQAWGFCWSSWTDPRGIQMSHWTRHGTGCQRLGAWVHRGSRAPPSRVLSVPAAPPPPARRRPQQIRARVSFQVDPDFLEGRGPVSFVPMSSAPSVHPVNERTKERPP